jgi:phosphoglycolate phosphatase-like HAD superfamily hydrolase
VTSRSLQQIISHTRHVLLDFDGPVCRLFAGIPASSVASQLRDALRAAAFAIPPQVADDDDPLEVFRAVATFVPDAAALAQELLTTFEKRAARTAEPTHGSADLIITACRTGRTVTIVSNNSGSAVASYLADHDLMDYVTAVVGRDDADQDRMKPSPYRVREAVGQLRAGTRECALIGDSESDVLAARLAGVAVIGYANRPDKIGIMARARPDALATDLAEITTALRVAPVSALPN